ncbi:MAG: hypothetical protein KZQ66_03755 [Candidatus Thiodiazotropha sp. (ex Lucinoma aequizonata)]|nr:hypothetical protein [Candidatus Thiodiazotropha sp. (ex Lucinoma aequizonata)]MCU7888748.1 hypothetical protein [Candidatus Thiodiazotropha sp. (ex Lucinoma aequizonata)]MCU7897086.1 hypothetical protein [Candidatus Thiodiazotropha sp. (ex Lucinoma aequizonata)]MCU7897651.1 hypothetical protein [Candidatus Thiodiazotropha sp. (ex Lucinoma aequizonata)]MCU7901229.1 hypothetical protein [Candidatus Thiodiazotropha sp. (ex Lucinoma aequizonata)]
MGITLRNFELWRSLRPHSLTAIQPRLRLSGTNRLCSVFHGGQRTMAI